MDFKHIFLTSKYQLLLPACFLNLVISASCFAVTNAEINDLENEYQLVTNQLYSSLADQLSSCRGRTRSLARLNSQLINLSKQGKNIIGICLIKNHLPLIEKNIDSKEIFPIFQFLLSNNNLKIANTLYRKARNEGEQSLVSNISFIYARYYLKRKNWKQVLKYIEGTYNDLTSDDTNLARLFTGIALQKIKKHRSAVKIYEQIPQQSQYYPAARLNIATAYIRQDWWTDAHTNINEILSNKNIKTNDEMINRLYLVLGYSLLRKEFYRDSREAFRNIELDSIYFNKALLGIALTATNQEDYISALNAINILKEKNTYDLSVDESHLLLPYTYEKLNQNMTASASYTDAKNYYEKRIKDLATIKSNNLSNISAKNILNNHNRINISNNTINYSDYYPVSFLENTAQLNDFSRYIEHIKDKKTLSRYTKLKNKHENFLSKMIGNVLDKRINYLNSYMNQSRYGLARLFDNSNI